MRSRSDESRRHSQSSAGLTVEAYIDSAPVNARPMLSRLRKAVKSAAPQAEEGISYGMPHYSFRGESGFASRLCYFGFLKGKNRIAFYTRPGFIEDYKGEVEPYLTTKSALQFPLDEPIPLRLVQKLVRNGVRMHALSRS